MNRRMIALVALATLLMMSLWLPGTNTGIALAQEATPTPAAEEEADAASEETEENEAEEEEDLQLVTARVSADLVQPGRVLMSACGNHWVYDSVPPLNGPNEEVNPLDGMLTALVACGLYIYEAVGIENEITAENLSGSATGEFDFQKIVIHNRRKTMPKYVIEREIPNVDQLNEAQLQGAAAQSCSALSEIGPQIQWIHSYVVENKTFCIYIAPDEETIREHARKSGFPANKISKVKAIIDPTTAEGQRS